MSTALYRAMKRAEDGHPLCEETARGLGARVPADIAVDAAGDVHPETGGMTAQRYFAIEQEILWGRAHGRLSEDREDRLLEESDELWRRMTADERAAADARGRAYTSIRTSAELPVRDTPVRIGDTDAPRRAA